MAIKSGIIQFSLPVIAFASTILLGSLLLWLDATIYKQGVDYIDALFVATSAVCITGLSSIDHSVVFSPVGHVIMLVLIQLGGLGIMTYSALLFCFFHKRISFDNRLSVSGTLLSDSSFDLGHFVQRLVLTVLCIESLGAIFMYAFYADTITPFHAVFLAVSAFCNAGFVLWSDGLFGWENELGLNSIIMLLIFLGGIGFFVLDEVLRKFWPSRLEIRSAYAKNKKAPQLAKKLSFQSRLVLSTSLALIVFGTSFFFLCEFFNPEWKVVSFGERVLVAMFHAVSARTAGFATVDLTRFTNLSLLILMGLMFIGGSPGSCAGGIKTTTLRALLGYAKARIRGTGQVIVAGKALEGKTVNKVLLLFFFSILILFATTFILSITENGAAHYGATKFQLLDLFFEAVSAFGTVGLSLNLTPDLSTAGKAVLCLVMFIGRLGPIWLLTTLQQFHTETKYRLPETDLPIG